MAFHRVSLLGPQLFNIYIKELFYNAEEPEICNYADNTTYASGYELKDVLLRLEHGSNTFLSGSESIEWHFMKVNVTYLFVDIKMNVVLQISVIPVYGKNILLNFLEYSSTLT